MYIHFIPPHNHDQITPLFYCCTPVGRVMWNIMPPNAGQKKFVEMSRLWRSEVPGRYKGPSSRTISHSVFQPDVRDSRFLYLVQSDGWPVNLLIFRYNMTYIYILYTRTSWSQWPTLYHNNISNSIHE